MIILVIFLKLLLLSRDLGVTHETDDPDNYSILFDKSINDINVKITELKSSLAWNWAFCNPQQKEHLRTMFLL